jgi:hypothetical protein
MSQPKEGRVDFVHEEEVFRKQLAFDSEPMNYLLRLHT